MDTNKLTKQINTMLRPRAALIAYSTDGGDTYFLEVRSIDNEGAMSEGRPVTVDFINELIKGYSERHSSTPHGRIPTNMLWSDTRKGYEKYIWYNPPQKRMMFFKESLHIENAEYNLPGVIYEVRDERMNIYAYIDKELKPETELYAAPFFNVTGSSVCLGSAKIDKPTEITYDKLLEYWEKKFWLTEFSHLGGNGNPTKSNLVLVTKAAKDAPFKIEELKPLKNLTFCRFGEQGIVELNHTAFASSVGLQCVGFYVVSRELLFEIVENAPVAVAPTIYGLFYIAHYEASVAS